MPRFCLMPLLILFFALKAYAQPPDQIEFFEKHVRPLLAERCISCHGPQKAKAKLRLDSRDAMLKGSENGAVIDLKNPKQSRLLEVVHYQSDIQMPPAGKLPDSEIAKLEQWILSGAPWPDNVRLASTSDVSDAARKHWAFQPIAKPPIPAVKDATWARTDLDRFILAKQEAAGLQPSSRADRRTLIRRATFDLHGLPPTPEEVSAFENDASANAFEKVVDRLLASPRYGERWARHWLDLARYADNKGYVFFEDKNYPWAFTYRDFVIAAFNRDLPFDRFVLEQLAADQLEGIDSKSLSALGFLTVGGHFMNNTHDIIDDRIDVVCRGFMGLTVSCARCHDHKFDPISQADYYSLYGVFRSCREPLVPPLLDKPPQTKEYQQFAHELAGREKKLRDFVEAKHRELVNGARARVAEYLLAVYVSRHQPPDDDFMLIADKGDLNPAMITRWRVYLEAAKKQNDPIWFPWHAFSAIPEKEFDKQSETALKTILTTPGLNPLVLLEFKSKPASMKEVAERYGKLFASIDKQWQALASEASSKKNVPPSKLGNADAEQLRLVLYGPHSPADAPVELDWGFLSLFPDRSTQDEFKKLIKDVEVQSEKGPPRSMVITDSVEPFEPQIFLRGQPNRLGEAVPRQFIKAVDPHRKPFQRGSGRLELAREIISPQNPLTARVLGNRVWLHHMGGGFVSTPSDFGLRGATPTHPELLDFLAKDFMNNGWSLKRLHRLIMTSAVYQQSSNDRSDARAIDPENLLLWKMNRQRLEFEPLHDSLLAVSGQLDLTMGGPAVPLFSGKNRRAIYGYIDRLDFPSLLTTFDMPNPAASVPQRSLTTIAPQALYLMNGPLVRQAAERILSLSAIKNQKNASEKIDAIYRILFQRLPKENERHLALAYLRESGLAGAEPSHDRWVDYVHGLLMTNEFAFVD